MRLLNILLKPSELWRMGLELIGRKLGYGAESRRLAEAQATIAQLRDKLHLAEMRVEFLESQLSLEQSEHRKQKNATAQMWKFIHTRHRIDIEPAVGSIEQALRKADKR